MRGNAYFAVCVPRRRYILAAGWFFIGSMMVLQYEFILFFDFG